MSVLTIVAMASALASAPAQKETGKTGPELAQVDARQRLLRLDFPPSPHAERGFAVCDGGLVLVPVRGGIAAAGWHGWLREPSTQKGVTITAVTCDSEGRVFVVDDRNRLQRIEGRIVDGALRVLADLGTGQSELRAGADASIWILTRGGSAVTIARWTEKKGLEKIWSGPAKLGGMAALGRRSLLTCGKVGVDLWRPNRAPKRLFDLPFPCDGIAAGADGSVFVSTPKGVVQLPAKSSPKAIVRGLHGPLAHDGRSLFVAAASGTIYQLIPDAKPPKPLETRTPESRSSP